jgi:hypothetical protein
MPATQKSAIDGIADALGVDDSTFQVHWPTEWGPCDRPHGSVTVELRPLSIQGILRRRFNDKHGRYIAALDEMMQDAPFDVEVLEAEAKQADTWEDFCDSINELIERGAD